MFIYFYFSSQLKRRHKPFHYIFFKISIIQSQNLPFWRDSFFYLLIFNTNSNIFSIKLSILFKCFFLIIFLTPYVHRFLSLSLSHHPNLQFLNPNPHQNPLPLNDNEFTKATNKKEDRDQTSETLLKQFDSKPKSKKTPKKKNHYLFYLNVFF